MKIHNAIFVCLALCNCEDRSIFRPVNGAIHLATTNAREVSITDRARLKECGAQLLGVLEKSDPNIVPYETNYRGGNYYIRVDNAVEVWRADDIVCVKRSVK